MLRQDGATHSVGERIGVPMGCVSAVFARRCLITYGPEQTMSGMQIREPLPLRFGNFAFAEIHADLSGWRLEFGFYGPDRRHNLRLVTFGFNEAPHLGGHLEAAFNKYVLLKPRIAPGAEFEEQFGYVTLRIGGFADGICLGNYHVQFKTQEGLDDYLSVLANVEARGNKLVAGLRQAADLEAQPVTPTPSSSQPRPVSPLVAQLVSGLRESRKTDSSSPPRSAPKPIRPLAASPTDRLFKR